MTRRALLGVAAAAVAGGVLAVRRLLGDDLEPVEQGAPGWAGSWTSPHWQRLSTRGGTRMLALPDASAGAAPDQPVPVFLQDREFVEGEVELSFLATTPSLRPGVLFGALAPFAFMGVTVERDRLVLARYGREERTVLTSSPLSPLEADREYRLRVDVRSSETRAALSFAGDEEPDWQLTAPHRPGRGGPGVLVVQPTDGARAQLEVLAFEVRPSGDVGTTEPVSPVVLTGTPQPAANGSYSALVSVWSAWPASVVFERSTSPRFASAEQFATVSVEDPPFVARARVQSGEGETTYWRARLRSRTSGPERTTPIHALHVPNAERPLVLLAASCIQFAGAPPNRGFAHLLRAAPERPALLVFQGDLGYAGNVANAAYAAAPDFFADRFQRTLARDDFALLRQDVPVGFTLDDHDYGPPNNANRTSVRPWAVNLWNRLHADPSPHGYFETRFGDVHCLILDVRRYADPARSPNTPEKTRLGQEQLAWLEQALRESDAGMFVVFSAGTFARRWDPDTKKPVTDTFIHGWPEEYRRLMDLFGSIQAGGRRVVIVSGDAHGLRVHRHPDPLSGISTEGGHIVELICSGLRTALWSTAPPDDPTVDPERAVTGRPGAGMIVVDPASETQRRITLRAVAADDGSDVFPPLRLPFEPGG